MSWVSCVAESGATSSDRVEVPRLVASVFHDQPLDLVVDDASHADVLKKSDQDIVIEELKHVYELSAVCSKKFQKLKIAVWAGGIGLALGVLFILLVGK